MVEEMEKWRSGQRKPGLPGWPSVAHPPCPRSTPALGVGLSVGGSQKAGTDDCEWWFQQRQWVSGTIFASVGQLTGSEGVKGLAGLKR